jgi:hypothetical protein
MSETRKGAAAASVEEDPNAAITCSSPPCFMHELDPTYLGYLGREEVRALLGPLLAAEWGGAGPDEARLRAALRRHLKALGGRPDHTACASRSAASAGAPDLGPDGLAPMVREALPRIHDDALRRDLEEALGALGAKAP